MNKLEIWKDIKGWEGLYQISNMGRIKSLSRYRYCGKLNSKPQLMDMKIMKPSIRGGYEIVSISREGKVESFSVHRLVGKHFIPNPNNYPEINHKDEVKTNNNVNNLEWCTKAYNMKYGTLGERISKSLSKIVHQYDLDNNLVNIWSSTREVNEHGFHHSNVASCCRGERKTHKGFVWKYEEDIIYGE